MTTTLTCPKCGSSMRQYERNRVLVDQCTGCGGLFLDRGELEADGRRERVAPGTRAAHPSTHRSASTRRRRSTGSSTATRRTVRATGRSRTARRSPSSPSCSTTESRRAGAQGQCETGRVSSESSEGSGRGVPRRPAFFSPPRPWRPRAVPFPTPQRWPRSPTPLPLCSSGPVARPRTLLSRPRLVRSSTSWACRRSPSSGPTGRRAAFRARCGGSTPCTSGSSAIPRRRAPTTRPACASPT